MENSFDYRITATITEDDDLEWLTRYFVLADVPLPHRGSRVQISCRKHEEFSFSVNEKLIWSGTIPFQLQHVEVLIRAKQLPADAIAKEKITTPVVTTFWYSALALENVV